MPRDPIYCNDTCAASYLTARITRYEPGASSEDLTPVTSTGSSGYGTTLSPRSRTLLTC